MGLQVRLRHALGERVLDLPERGVDRPLVIGRAADADVQVPSVHVAHRQLVVFVHEGRWVVQDAPGGTGTTVNGTALRGPRPLRGGDVLALGPEADAPTVEVDAAAFPKESAAPAGADVPAAAPAAAPPAPARAGGPVPPPMPVRPQPAASAAAVDPSRFAPPVPDVVVETLGGNGAVGGAAVAAPAVTAGAETEVPATEWTAPAYVPGNTRRRGRSWVSQLVGALSVVLSVAIVTGAVLYVYVRKQDQERQDRERAAVAAQQQQQQDRERREAADRARAAATQAAGARRPPSPPRPVPAIAAPPPPRDVTEELEGPAAATRQVAVATPDAPATAPATRRVAAAGDAPDAQFFGDNVNDGGAAGAGEMSEEDREWKRVESVYYHPNVAKALLTFDSFAERFPNARKAQLEKYREDMLDKLWWNRIDSLVDKRKKLTAQVRETQAKIKKETEEAFRKTVLEPQFELQRAELVAVTDRLRKEMMYNADAAPPIGDEKQMKAFRDKRDRITYDQWKKATLKHIRDNHGAYPWANEG